MQLVTVPNTEQLVATQDGQLRKIDARVCIEFEPKERKTSFTHQDIDLYDVRAVCRRIELSCHLHLLSAHYRDDLEDIDLGMGNAKIGLCIAYDHWTRKISYVRRNLDYHDAAIACAQAAAICEHLLMHQLGQIDKPTEG